MGGSQSASSRQSNFIAPQQVPYLQDLYARAQGVSQQPRSFFPGQTYVPQSAETEQALQLETNRAHQGSPLLDAARGYTGSVLRGDYLDPSRSPFLRDTFEAAARPVISSFQRTVLPGASLGMYGRGGSGHEANRQATAYDQILGRSLNDLASSIYGGNYSRERAYQDSAAQRAPALEAMPESDVARLREVGAAREEFSGRQLQDLMERYYFGQQEAGDRLGQYAQLIGSPAMQSTGRSSSSGWNIL